MTVGPSLLPARNFRSLGLRFELAASTGGALDVAERLLPPRCAATTARTVHAHFALHAGAGCVCGTGHPDPVVWHDDQVVGAAHTVEDALHLLRATIKMWIASTTRRFVFVHAGAVGWNGRGVLIPGPTGSGKSSLVRELIRVGAVYCSDDMALLDGQGALHPYPLPIGQRARLPDGSLHPHQADLDPRAVGAAVAEGPLPVGLVLDSRYDRHAEWAPQLVAPGPAALLMLSNCVAARRRPEAALESIGRAVRGAECWSGNRSDAGDVIRLLESRLGPLR